MEPDELAEAGEENHLKPHNLILPALKLPEDVGEILSGVPELILK